MATSPHGGLLRRAPTYFLEPTMPAMRDASTPRRAAGAALLLSAAMLLVHCGDDEGGAGGSAGQAATGGTTTTGGGVGGSGGAGALGGQGGAAGSAGAGGGGCTNPPTAPLVNALVLPGDELLALYPAPEPTTGAAAYRMVGDSVEALDGSGASLWTASPGQGVLFGGFDFDQDGWTDLGVVHQQSLGQLCGTTPMLETWITILRGVDGSTATTVSPLADICWTFGSVQYPTSQWTSLSVLFGPSSSVLGILPYYATTGWQFTWSGSFSSEYFYFPSTSSYDSSYTADQPNAWGTGTSYLANSHVANGLVAEIATEERLVFFTSGRVVQYAIAPFSASQLLFDRPYLTGGRTDIAGRNYGLVARDPGSPHHIALIAGTHGQTLYADRLSGAPGADPWAAIERHVSLYDLSTNSVTDRFFSYAHDDNDGHQYEGRVAYPDTAFVGRGAGQPSRLAFNVFGSGHWTLHVTAPGSVDDALTIADLYLWDIRDLDGDGTDEWIASPTTTGYLPDWQTQLYHWDEPSVNVSLVHSYGDRLPARVAHFRQPARTTSYAFLYPTLTVAEGCALRLLTRTSGGALEAVPLP